MKIRFYNARIVTMKDREIINGELWTDDDKILFVGTKDAAESDGLLFDRDIDCGGNLLMPGIKNCHTHSAMTFSRSVADNYELNDWLHKSIFPMEAKLNDELTYHFSRLAFAEYLRNGITSCFDMYFHLDGVVKAAKEIGFRLALCGSVNDYGGIDVAEDEYLKYNQSGPLISYYFGVHAEYTTSPDILKRVSDLIHKYNAPSFAHVSETRSEVEGCISRYGITPPQLFDKFGFYDFGGGGYHCVYFTDDDINLYADKGLYAVFNPCSNLKLASGIANIPKFISSGVRFGIGTDGAGSNNALDMFREMYLASVLSNVINEKAFSVDPYLILKGACSDGALLMGHKDCDVLEKGKKADVIMIDMKAPSMKPESDILRNIVYSGNPSIVKMTMIGGNILYEDGKFTTLDIDDVYKECQIRAEEIRSL